MTQSKRSNTPFTIEGSVGSPIPNTFILINSNKWLLQRLRILITLGSSGGLFSFFDIYDDTTLLLASQVSVGGAAVTSIMLFDESNLNYYNKGTGKLKLQISSNTNMTYMNYSATVLGTDLT